MLKHLECGHRPTRKELLAAVQADRLSVNIPFEAAAMPLRPKDVLVLTKEEMQRHFSYLPEPGKLSPKNGVRTKQRRFYRGDYDGQGYIVRERSQDYQHEVFFLYVISAEAAYLLDEQALRKGKLIAISDPERIDVILKDERRRYDNSGGFG